MKRIFSLKILFLVALTAVIAFGGLHLTTPPVQADGCPPSMFGCPYYISLVDDDGRFCCLYNCPNGNQVKYCC